MGQVPYFKHFLFSGPEKPFRHFRGWQGGLGTGLSTALGAKLADCKSLVVCVIGDGALNYNPVQACFGLAQQYCVPLLCLVLNNDGFCSQAWNVEKYFADGAAV